MVLRKQWISLAAAAALAVGFAGCGGSDNTPITPPSTTGIASTVSVTKGYVVDANVTGRKAAGTIVAQYTYKGGFEGKYDTNLTDATTIDTIDYLQVSPKSGQSALVMSSDGKTNDINGSGTLKAPARGFTTLSGISTSLVDLMLANTTDYNISNEANITALVEKLATALGTTAAELKTADMTQNDTAAKEKLHVANAILGTASAATSADLLKELIKNTTAPADLSAMISNIETAANTVGDNGLKAFATLAKTYVKSGSLAHIDMEKAYADVVKNGVSETSFIPKSTASDLRLVYADSGYVQLYDGAVAKTPDGLQGFKIDNDLDQNLTFFVEAADANYSTTGKTATFGVEISSVGDAIKNKDSIVEKMAFSITADLNNTADGKIALQLDTNESKVNVNVLSTSSEGKSYSDTWTLKDLGVADGTAIIKTDSNNKTYFDFSTLASKIKTALDTNHTKSGGGANFDDILNDDIKNVDIVLDTGTVSLLKYKTDTKKAYATTTKTAGSVTGYSLVSLTNADSRGSSAMANNSAPLFTAVEKTFVGDETAAAINGITPAGIWNVDTKAVNDGVQTIKLKFTDSDSAFEKNTSVTVSMASKVMTDGNASVNFLLADFNATKLADVNITTNAYDSIEFKVDNNLSTSSIKTAVDAITTRHPMATYTFVATDEFGLKGNETNLTIALNRAPSADVNLTSGYFVGFVAAADFNVTNGTTVMKGTGTVDGSVNITDYALVLSDKDGVNDINNTASVDMNVSAVEVSGLYDHNFTLGGAYSTTGQEIIIVDGDGNTTKIGFVLAGTTSKHIELNATLPSKWKVDTDANLTIKFNDRYDNEGSKKVRIVIPQAL